MSKGAAVMGSVRWAVRVASWQPTREQWVRAAQCVQPEEKQRIGKFVFQRDAKSAMVGRLLLRKVIHDCLNLAWNDIKLKRTEKGKPYLENSSDAFPNFNFNVSHQGEYAVLAAEPVHQVGVDVMRVEYARGAKTTQEFFQTMERQFTANEWASIKDSLDEWEQLAQFYRFWCLKESYVKALGVGIGFSLQRLDFRSQSVVDPGAVLCDTRLCVDDALCKDWLFEESQLDSAHCVATALQQVGKEALPKDGTPFQLLQVDDLLEEAQSLTDPDTKYWTDFAAKDTDPSQRR